MKKLIIITTLLFQIANSFSQTKDVYGNVYYKFQPNNIEVLNNENTKQHVKDFFKGIKEYMSNVKFKLKFFNNTSIFTLGDEMDSEINLNGGLIANKLVSKGSYYCDLDKDIQLRKIEGEEFLIKTQPSKIKWELTQETKNINNFKCYKAITSVINKNFSGEHKFEIIAWYTPEIPVPFGPKQFNSLPGLILELKDTHNTFFAEKIELYPKEKIIIKPFKGKIILEEKYNEKIKENLREFLKN